VKKVTDMRIDYDLNEALQIDLSTIALALKAELALNGLDSFQIKQLLGKPLKRVGKHWFYSHKDRVLTLRFHEKYVNYIKYIHLNQAYTPAIDAALLE
jgi:hypothetical protein